MKSFSDIFKMLNKYERKQLVLTTLAWTLWSVFGVLTIVLILLMGQEIASDNFARTNVYYYWGAIIATFILKGVAFAYAHSKAHFTGYALMMRIRNEFIDKMKMFSLGFFTKERLGNISTIIHHDVGKIEILTSHIWTKLVSDVLTALIIGIALFILDWRMGLALISLLPVAFFFLWYGRIKGEKIHKENRENMADMVSSFVEYVKGIPVIKVFSENPTITNQLQERIGKFRKSSKSAAVVASKTIGSYFLFLELCFGVLVAIGAYLVLGNEVSIYVFAIFIILGKEFYKPFLNAETYLVFYITAKDSFGRVASVLQHPTMQALTTSKTPTSYDICFKNVSFEYEENAFNIVDTSFKCREGTITAFVGSSGAGKTTITNLIARFWDVCEGSIMIGGIDIRDIEYDELLSMMGIVMQNVILFNDTIAENIKVGKKNATKQEIEKAAKEAMIHDFIISLPQGYDTLISEDAVNLSGGQKQRISIARMMLKDAPIIILDEMTSAIDPINERKIQKAMNNLIKGRTTLVIAHHLHTIRYANQIIVLDEGRIVEKGKHDSLLKLDGIYKKLWDSQMQAKEWEIAR